MIKIAFSCAVGLYMFLVCFNNVFDYSPNFPFTQKVASMEDIFSAKKNGWRSVRTPFVHYLLFGLIVIWEFCISVLLWLRAYKIFRALASSRTDFRTAKKYTGIGLSFGVLLWFAVF